MTNPSWSAPPPPGRPTPLRVLWPVMLVRTAFAPLALVVSLSALPGVVERGSRTLVDQRTGDVLRPVPHLDVIAVAAGVLGGAIGLLWLGVWLYLGRRALGGTRWAAVVVAVLSALAVLGALGSGLLTLVTRALPATVYAVQLPTRVWVVSAVQGAVDLVVVALLTAPSSRRWFDALAPPPPGGPVPFPPGHRH